MQITAKTRKLQGTGASRRMRIAGTTPGIIYGGVTAPAMIEIEHNGLFHALRKEAFHASILDMELDGVKQQVLLRDFQMHPFKQLVLHIDFQRVEAGSEIKMSVPIHYQGEENSPAVKLGGSLINHVANEIMITCLPANLPTSITVDLSNIVAGKTLFLSDIALPNGVRAIAKPKTVIASAAAAAKEEEAKS